MAVVSSISTRMANIFTRIVLIGFTAFSTGLSIFLFLNMADQDWLKPVYIGLGFMWEFGILVVLIRMKTLIRDKKTKNAVGYGIAYFIMALISIFGSIGFNIATVNHQAVEVQNNSVKSNSNLELIKSKEDKRIELVSDRDGYKADVEKASKDMKKFDLGTAEYNSALKARDKAQAKKETKQNEIDAVDAELTKLKNIDTKSTSVSTTDIFASMGSFIGVSGEGMKNFIFVIIALVIQLAIAVTAPEIGIKKVKLNTVDKKKLLDYAEALFPDSGRRLLNDAMISEKLRIDIQECYKLRRTLKEMTFKGEPLLIANQGGTKIRYSKENFLKIVNHLVDSLKIDEDQ